MEIHFDAAKATLIDCSESTEELLKNNCFKWINLSIEMQNIMGLTAWQNPVRYAYDSKNKSFASGLIPRVCNFLEGWDIQYTLRFLFDPFTAKHRPTPDYAWPHQKELIQHLMTYRRCIIQSPTASGKTTSISMVIDKFPDKNVLVCLHQLDLITDMVANLEEALDIPIGKIGGGKYNWQRVTVASMQTLSNRANKDFKEILEGIDVLIFDECHHYANKSGNNISNACKNTSYRLGLSATPQQSDGSDILLEGVIGPTTLIIPDTLMVDLGIIHRPDVHFIEVEDPKLQLPINEVIGKPQRQSVVEQGIILNDQRNNLIVDILKEFKKAENNRGCALVLIEDVKNDHGPLLVGKMKKEGIHAVCVAGQTKQNEREEILKGFKSGELSVLVATKILNEGKDIPLLELVINAAGGSGERGIIQKVGRALRKDETERKTRAMIVDFLDMEPYYLNSNSHSRMKHLNSRHPDCARISTLEELYDTFRRRPS